MTLDELDRRLLLLMLENPRAGLREHARTLGVAHGTVSARFLRLQEAGVDTVRLYPAGATLAERLTTLGRALDLLRR